jgi:hypothetical protein
MRSAPFLKARTTEEEKHMVKPYRVTLFVRLSNLLATSLAHLGLKTDVSELGTEI